MAQPILAGLRRNKKQFLSYQRTIKAGFQEVGWRACTHLCVLAEPLKPKRWANLLVVNSVSKSNQLPTESPVLQALQRTQKLTRWRFGLVLFTPIVGESTIILD